MAEVSGSVGRTGPTAPERGLLAHSAVYSLAPVVRYAVSFGMNRFYTYALITALYGVKEMVDLWMILLQQVLGQNLLSGMVRFYYDHQDPTARRRVVTSVTLVLASVAWVVCGSIWLFTDTLAPLLIGRPTAEVSAGQIESAFRFLVVLVPFQLTSLSGFYYLQTVKRSALFTSAQTAKLLLEVALHVVFMGVLGLGLNGFLLGLLIGEIVTSCALTGWILWTLGPRVDWRVFRPVLVYAAPLIPVGVFQLGLHQLDRRLIEVVFSGAEGLALAGIYGLGYKIGYLINPIFLWPFMQIWQPTLYGIVDEQERARLVSRVTTWMVTAIGAASLLVIFGGRQAVDLIAGQEDYLAAHVVVPWVAAGYVFWSLYNAAHMPLLIAKRTPPLLWINLAALVFCIAANLLLIPRLGILGAALSTTATFALLAGMVLLAARTVSNVSFELGRLAGALSVVLAACLLAGPLDRLEVYTSLPRAAAVLALKAALCLLALSALWLGVLRREERQAALAAVRARFPRRGR